MTQKKNTLEEMKTAIDQIHDEVVLKAVYDRILKLL